MQNLAAGLLADQPRKTDDTDKRRADLDDIITSLRREQARLEQRFSVAAHGPRKRRLKTAIQVSRLKLKKALALHASLK